MNDDLEVIAKIKKSDARIWVVKTYIDLLTRSDDLVYGSGLKRLYVMSKGNTAFNHTSIIDATNKAISMGLIPEGLKGFMNSCIAKNSYLYGVILKDIIEDRILSIASGDVVNPEPRVRSNPERSRRYYYTPPASFIKRLYKAIKTDFGPSGFYMPPAIPSFEEVALESEYILTRMSGSEGYSQPEQTSFKGILSCVNALVTILESSSCNTSQEDYKAVPRNILKILWSLAKLLTGDLTTEPRRSDIEAIDLTTRISISDGTLAAIPFPIPASLDLFCEYEEGNRGISMKGRTYLSAVSSASFNK